MARVESNIAEIVYTLTLSQAEAEVLASMLASTGGDSVRSPRKLARGILEGLGRAGVDWDGTDAYELLSGSLHFADGDA